MKRNAYEELEQRLIIMGYSVKPKGKLAIITLSDYSFKNVVEQCTQLITDLIAYKYIGEMPERLHIEKWEDYYEASITVKPKAIKA